MPKQFEMDAKTFKALSDPNRLMIIETLQNGDKCACKILEELNIVQSTLSHHMKILCDSGLVESNKVGKWMHYVLNKEAFEAARNSLDDIIKKIR